MYVHWLILYIRFHTFWWSLSLYFPPHGISTTVFEWLWLQFANLHVALKALDKFYISFTLIYIYICKYIHSVLDCVSMSCPRYQKALPEH